MRFCSHCGTQFAPPRSDATYCTKSCRDRAYKARRREREGPPKQRGRDLAGMKFGRLTVIGKTSKRVNTFIVHHCICDCGGTAYVPTGLLTSGAKKSCGCLHADAARDKETKYRTHGMHNTPTYKTWISIKSRCSDPNNASYPSYGGRGIKMCERWSNSFENFLADVGERPAGMTIDRINPDGMYEPGNCRWASPKQQANNRRNNVWVEHEGELMTMAQYAEAIGMSYSGATKKIKREGRMVPGGAFVKE